MEVSTIFTYYATYANEFTYYATYANEIKLVHKGGTQHNIINYATCADEGGTQGAILCYITKEPKLYNPVSWDFAIVQNEGDFMQYSGYSYNC